MKQIILIIIVLAILNFSVFDVNAATGVTMDTGVVAQGQDGVKASAVLAGTPNLLIEAAVSGLAGNGITINFTRFGDYRPTEGIITSVTGNQINYLYSSGGSSTNMLQAGQVLNADAGASQLVKASGGDSSVYLHDYLVGLYGLTDYYLIQLEGGADVPIINEVFDIMITNGAVADGIIKFTIGSKSYLINAVSGDSAADIAAKLNSAIIANPLSGYLNNLDGDSVILTSVIAGDVADLTAALQDNGENSAPIIDYISISSPAYEEEIVTITTVASDPDGDALTYSINDAHFTQTATPGVFEWQTKKGDGGLISYNNITVTVSDGIDIDSKSTYAIVTDPSTLVVNAPQVLPELPLSFSIAAGQYLSFPVSAFHFDLVPLDFTSSNLPNKAEYIYLGNYEAIFRWAPTLDDVGQHDLTFYFSDGINTVSANTAVEVMASLVCMDGQTRSCYSGPAGTENVGICTAGTQACAGGVWGACLGEINPYFEEICNNFDDDCDGVVDNGFPITTSYEDFDNDLYGNPLIFVEGCLVPAGYVTDSTDCNDYVSFVNPGMNELCNDGVDNDCNGLIDSSDLACITLDTISPIITILGQNPVNVTQNSVYVDAGATAIDDVDGDITASIIYVNNVETAVLGTYNITYDVADAAGNPAVQAVRVVNVIGSSTVCQTAADTNSDGIISSFELLSHIGLWKQNIVTNLEIFQAISFWKIGAGC